MKLKLVAAISALAIPALAHAEQSGPQPAVPKPTKIYEPHEQITARIEATIDTLINEFAEAGHTHRASAIQKYGAPQ